MQLLQTPVCNEDESEPTGHGFVAGLGWQARASIKAPCSVSSHASCAVHVMHCLLLTAHSAWKLIASFSMASLPLCAGRC